MTANCPICSRELESELKAKAPPRPQRARGSAPATGRPRGSAPLAGVVTRRVARAADDGYRSPLAPGLRATADAERLAAALTQAAARLAPPGPVPRDRHRARPRGGHVAGVPARARRPRGARAAGRAARGAPAVGRRRARRPAGRAPPHRRGLPRLGRARRLPAGRVRGRRRLDARAPLLARVRAPRAARLRPRPPLRPADRARRRRAVRAAAPTSCTSAATRTPPRSPPSACWCPATGGCSSAARASWPRRASVPIAALDRGLAIWNTPGARGRPRPPRCRAPSARRSACGERRGRAAGPRATRPRCSASSRSSAPATASRPT